MKKIFTLLLFMWLTNIIASAQVILDETFNYSEANLKDVPGWITNPAGTVPGIGTTRDIITPALTYITAEGTYVLSDKGKAIFSDYTSGAADYYCFKKFTSTPVTSTIYLSFLLKPGVGQKQSQSEIIGLGDSASSGPKVWLGKGTVNTVAFRFGTTRQSGTGADIKWGTTEYTDTLKTYLVVLKYDFTSSTSSIFINPTLATSVEPAPDASENTAGTIRTKLSSLRFRVNGNNKAKWSLSGARISSSWTDAVANTATTSLHDIMNEKARFKIYPNPASDKINFDYTLLEGAKVRLDIYNLNSQIAKSLMVNEHHGSGNYSRSFDVSGLKPGIYFARLTTGTTSKMLKLVVKDNK